MILLFIAIDSGEKLIRETATRRYFGADAGLLSELRSPGHREDCLTGECP